MIPRVLGALCLSICLAACALSSGGPPRGKEPGPPRQLEDSGDGGLGRDGRARGRLAPELIQRVVREGFPAMRVCYEAGLGRDRKLAGRLAVRFVIERDGKVGEAREDTGPSITTPREEHDELPNQAPFPDRAVVACVDQYKRLAFPPPDGGIVTVVFPIRFDPAN